MPRRPGPLEVGACAAGWAAGGEVVFAGVGAGFAAGGGAERGGGDDAVLEPKGLPREPEEREPPRGMMDSTTRNDFSTPFAHSSPSLTLTFFENLLSCSFVKLFVTRPLPIRDGSTVQRWSLLSAHSWEQRSVR